MKPEEFMQTIREKIIDRGASYFYKNPRLAEFPDKAREVTEYPNNSGLLYDFNEWRYLTPSKENVRSRWIKWGVQNSFKFPEIKSPNQLANFSVRAEELIGYIVVKMSYKESDDTIEEMEINTTDLETVDYYKDMLWEEERSDKRVIRKGQPIHEALDIILNNAISLSTLTEKVSV